MNLRIEIRSRDAYRQRTSHIRAAAVVMLGAVVPCLPAWASTSLGQPTGTFAPGPPPSLTSFMVSVYTSSQPSARPLDEGTPVTLCYINAAGGALAPIATEVGPGGVLSVPPPPIPPGAAAMGGKVTVKTVAFGESPAIVWYDSPWRWGFSPVIKIDPIGLPTPGGSQHWFFDLSFSDLHLDNSSTEFGARTLNISSSGLDVRYSSSPSAPGLYDVIVDGNASFVQFDDVNTTRMSLLDGTLLGQIGIGQGLGPDSSGLLNLPGLGMTGQWTYEAASNYTSAIMTPLPGPSGQFNAPAISQVPAPAVVSVFAVAGVWWRRRRMPTGV